MLTKIHLEKFIFVFFTRLLRYSWSWKHLSYVCGDFNDLQHARRFINRTHWSRAPAFEPKKKHACSPCAVNDFNKTYSTSAAPLLVQNVWYVCGAVARNSRNISKIKLKKH